MEAQSEPDMLQKHQQTRGHRASPQQIPGALPLMEELWIGCENANPDGAIHSVGAQPHTEADLAGHIAPFLDEERTRFRRKGRTHLVRCARCSVTRAPSR